ncbi:transmembrane protein 199 [Drosophila serrata]|uniref:transmembrane protein 199 n=1 Tax=Drosophila serrata TaxID=7274 RepID=UPI000A1D1F5F|nr:transmembrane protein 199 [Drosophila serrata]
MLKSTIVDTRVRLVPSEKVLTFLDAQKEHFEQVPENVARLMKLKGYKLPASTKIIKDREVPSQRPKIDQEQLKKLTADIPEKTAVAKKPVSSQEDGEDEAEDEPRPELRDVLYLSDLHWLTGVLNDLRREERSELFLHELIESCELVLPENELKPRNPELEARCQRLREEQQNREYQKMTKNVDAGLKNFPEDTISYQIKSINKQIIAVAQFIFSVAAGFTFGFFGVNLMVGPLPFGFRILLGVIVALIIALAEMYFLAKKLHEYDEVLDAPKRKPQPATPVKRKQIVRSTLKDGSGDQTLKPHAD